MNLKTILLDYPSPVLASGPLLVFLKIRVWRRTVVREEVQRSKHQIRIPRSLFG